MQNLETGLFGALAAEQSFLARSNQHEERFGCLSQVQDLLARIALGHVDPSTAGEKLGDEGLEPLTRIVDSSLALPRSPVGAGRFEHMQQIQLMRHPLGESEREVERRVGTVETVYDNENRKGVRSLPRAGGEKLLGVAPVSDGQYGTGCFEDDSFGDRAMLRSAPAMAPHDDEICWESLGQKQDAFLEGATGDLGFYVDIGGYRLEQPLQQLRGVDVFALLVLLVFLGPHPVNAQEIGWYRTLVVVQNQAGAETLADS